MDGVGEGRVDKAILLAVAASLCTATSSICQRLGASRTQADRSGLRLIMRLARRPAAGPIAGLPAGPQPKG